MPTTASATDVFLTLDAGGTSTRALVHDREGNCLGYGIGAGGNPTAHGVAAAADAIAGAARSALDSAGALPAQVGTVLAAMAGSASGLTGMGAGLHQLGVAAPMRVAGDLEALFCSGTERADGAALVAGTGAAAIAVRAGQVVQRVDGRGWLMGDVGSGFWIARRVLRAAAADLDGYGPPTAMTASLLAAVDVPAPERAADRELSMGLLVDRVYRIGAPGVARFATIAFAHPGDAEATRIVEQAARGLATAIAALHERPQGTPVVMGGSVLYHQAALRDRVVELVEDHDLAEVILSADGMPGAVVMALRSAGVEVGADLHRHIRDGVSAVQHSAAGTT